MDLDAGRLQLQLQPRVWALDPQVVDGIEAPALGRSTPLAMDDNIQTTMARP